MPRGLALCCCSTPNALQALLSEWLLFVNAKASVRRSRKWPGKVYAASGRPVREPSGIEIDRVRRMRAGEANERAFTIDALQLDAWPVAILAPDAIALVLPEPTRESACIGWLSRDTPAADDAGQIKGKVEPNDQRSLPVGDLPQDLIEELATREQAQRFAHLLFRRRTVCSDILTQRREVLFRQVVGVEDPLVNAHAVEIDAPTAEQQPLTGVCRGLTVEHDRQA